MCHIYYHTYLKNVFVIMQFKTEIIDRQCSFKFKAENYAF